MGRMYTVPFDDIQVTNDADQDIWIMQAGAATPLVLHGFQLTSETVTDERLRLRLLRRTTLGTGGTGATEVAVDGNNTDAADTGVTQLVTAPGTAGAVLQGWTWSQLVPLDYLPTPEGRVLVPAGGFLALHLQTALAATTGMSGYILWEEF